MAQQVASSPAPRFAGSAGGRPPLRRGPQRDIYGALDWLGSAFAGLGANNPFYNLAGGLAMLFARYWLAIPTLAIAGSLAKKKLVPAGPGTLATHTPLFIAMLLGIVIIVGALTFFPALSLSPILQHFQMYAGQTF